MNRMLLIGLMAATLPVAAVIAQDDAGSTTEKRETPEASGSPAVPAPEASGSHEGHNHGPGEGHGHGAGSGSGGDGHGHGANPHGASPHGENPHGANPHAGSPHGGGADSGAAPVKPGPDGTQTVTVEKLSFNIPAAWKSVPPASSMRKAQLMVPRTEGDTEDGEINISFFPGGGGGIEPNVQRWYGQMETADGKPVTDVAKRETLKAATGEVVLVDITGTLKASPMMGIKEDKKGWRMLAGIVNTSDGPWFFKGTGPEKTMAAALADFKKVLGSVTSK